MRSLRKSALELRDASSAVFASFVPAISGLLACSLALTLTLTADARAQQIAPPTVPDPAPVLLYDTGAFMPRIYGVAQPIAPRWKASYGLGRTDETSVPSTFFRVDEFLDAGELDSRGSRDDWRHFLGLEYAPMQGVALLGGIAKAGGINGSKGASLAPSGYEKIRLNTGARWRGDDWGLDGGFAFIPEGTNRVPSDAGFFPGMGGGGPTWLLSLTVSRRF
jgi:hypothetical protein